MSKQNYNLDIVIKRLTLEPELKENRSVYVKIQLGDVSINIHSKQRNIEDFNEGRSFEFNCTTEDIIGKLKSSLLLSVFCSQDDRRDEDGILLGSTSFHWPGEIYSKLLNDFSSHSTLNLLELTSNDKIVGTLILCTMLYCKCERRLGERKPRIEDEIKNLVDPNDMLPMVCGAGSRSMPAKNNFNEKNKWMCNECYEIADCFKDIKEIKKAKCCQNKLMVYYPSYKRKYKKFKSCDQIFGEMAFISEHMLESCDCSDSDAKEERRTAHNKIRCQTEIDAILTGVEKESSKRYINHSFRDTFELTSPSQRKTNDNIRKWYSKISQNLPTNTINASNEFKTVPEWTDQPAESPSDICKKVLGKKTDVYTPHLSKILEKLKGKLNTKNRKKSRQRNQKTGDANENGCRRNRRKISEKSHSQSRPKNKIHTKQDFVRYMRKKYKNRYTYDSSTNYPGVVLGHKQCLTSRRRVPSHMGWLWNCNTIQGRRGWRPGAVRKPVKALMTHFLNEYPLDTLPISSKASQMKVSTTNEVSYKTSEKEPTEQKPTVSVKKRNGETIVTMRPLKDAKLLEECSDPYLNVKPIQFKICKEPAVRHKNNLKTHLEELGFKKCSCGKSVSKCLCRSYMEKMRLQEEIAKKCCELNAVGLSDSFHYSTCSSSAESELDFEFTPPVALRKKERSKRVDRACKETQYDENEWKIQKVELPKDEVKNKKIKTPHIEKTKAMPTSKKRRKVPTKS